jgi:hypothetical protein
MEVLLTPGVVDVVSLALEPLVGDDARDEGVDGRDDRAPRGRRVREQRVLRQCPAARPQAPRDLDPPHARRGEVHLLRAREVRLVPAR